MKRRMAAFILVCCIAMGMAGCGSKESQEKKMCIRDRAAGSILFLKIGNEVYEDRERYRVLEKMGIQKSVLKKSVRNEICFTYYCPFVLMVLTSWFSVHALGNVMGEDLLSVNIWSAGIVLALFSTICMLSVHTAVSYTHLRC